jgi:hypothetical protein
LDRSARTSVEVITVSSQEFASSNVLDVVVARWQLMGRSQQSSSLSRSVDLVSLNQQTEQDGSSHLDLVSSKGMWVAY